MPLDWAVHYITNRHTSNPLTTQGIATEDKAAVIKRLVRAPDKADVVVMCWRKGVPGGYQRRGWGASEAEPKYKVIHTYENWKRWLWR